MEKLTPWKVLGGVVAGVGAVALLPVAAVPAIGAAGVVSLAGGIAGGVLGGAVGGGVAAWDERRQAAAREEGRLQGLAEAAATILKHREARKEDDDFYRFVLACVAVGLAAAACDGEVSEEEAAEIEEFSAGLGATRLPTRIRERIEEMTASPPSFNTAMEYVEPLPDTDHDTIEQVILLVIERDGVVRESEAAFLEAWRLHRAAA